MPIIELKSDCIQQLCAACQVTRDIPLASLTAGVKRGEHVDPCIIALPACSACGACEFLIRSASARERESVTPGSYGHLHRLLVDRLHQRLVDNGRLIKGAVARDIQPLPPVTPELETWLSSGARLPHPPMDEPGPRGA